MFSIERTIQVGFRLRVYFTRNVFAPANPLLKEVLLDSDSERTALRVLHESIEKGLQDLACSLEQVPGRGAAPTQRSNELLDVPWIMVPKSVEKAIDSFRELQMLCESIVATGA